MSMIDKAFKAVFGLTVGELVDRQPAFAGDTENLDHAIKYRTAEVTLVIMSRSTEREIMREDISNSTGIVGHTIKGEPKRLFGRRVAYDDSLQDGEFIVVEKFFTA